MRRIESVWSSATRRAKRLRRTGPLVIVLVAAGCAGAADDDQPESAEPVADAQPSPTAAQEPGSTNSPAPDGSNPESDVEGESPADDSASVTGDEKAEPPAIPEEDPRFASGYVGRLKLVDDIDDPAGYCLDVPGPASNIRLDIPAWAHSCHGGPEPDQTYRFDEDGNGAFRFVWEVYDVCLTATDAVAGSGLSYLPCDGGSQQAFDSAADGTFTLRGSDLCLSARNMDDAGSQDEVGIGRNVAPGDWVRGLQLRPCAEALDALTQWEPIADDDPADQ